MSAFGWRQFMEFIKNLLMSRDAADMFEQPFGFPGGSIADGLQPGLDGLQCGADGEAHVAAFGWRDAPITGGQFYGGGAVRQMSVVGRKQVTDYVSAIDNHSY